MRLGRTIAGNRDVVESELARQQLLEKREKKKKVQLLLLGIVIVVTVVLGVVIIQSAVKKVPAANQKKVETIKYTPTVSIIDEDGSNFITERTKQYVGLFEKDASESGLKIIKAIIPAGKAREVDLYFEGREEFYKCNLDRGTAETLEDVIRMIGFLKKQNLKVGYVDVRIEGRAYYKTI